MKSKEDVKRVKKTFPRDVQEGLIQNSSVHTISEEVPPPKYQIEIPGSTPSDSFRTGSKSQSARSSNMLMRTAAFGGLAETPREVQSQRSKESLPSASAYNQS